MKAYNIDWDVDLEALLDTIDNISQEEAADFFNIPLPAYVYFSDIQIRELAQKKLEGNDRWKAYELMSLPNEVELPPDVEEEEDAADWISDVFGFCIKGFEIEE